jgi:sec-independent protein translocase protein TatB
MFDMSWSELLIIAVVALIAIGPKELPGVLRAAGQWMGKIRRMASEFQGQFQEAMREAEMADIKKQVDELSEAASSVTSFDPIGNIEKEFQSAVEDKPAQPAEAAVAASDAPATATPGEPVPAVQDTVAQDNASAAIQGGPWPEPAAEPQPKAGSGA